jgi:hypothetical protein
MKDQAEQINRGIESISRQFNDVGSDAMTSNQSAASGSSPYYLFRQLSEVAETFAEGTHNKRLLFEAAKYIVKTDGENAHLRNKLTQVSEDVAQAHAKIKLANLALNAVTVR